MSLLVYRFDNVEAFPLLEVLTTLAEKPTLRIDGHGHAAILRMEVSQKACAAAVGRAVLALPPRTVEGLPQQFLLEIHGDANGCRVVMEAFDAGGEPLIYSFGVVDFNGWRTVGSRIADCGLWTGDRRGAEGDSQSAIRNPQSVSPPIDLCRLAILTGEREGGFSIGLRSICVTGHVRLPASGLARP